MPKTDVGAIAKLFSNILDKLDKVFSNKIGRRNRAALLYAQKAFKRLSREFPEAAKDKQIAKYIEKFEQLVI
jgi:hypothetical protein